MNLPFQDSFKDLTRLQVKQKSLKAMDTLMEWVLKHVIFLIPKLTNLKLMSQDMKRLGDLSFN